MKFQNEFLLVVNKSSSSGDGLLDYVDLFLDGEYWVDHIKSSHCYHASVDRMQSVVRFPNTVIVLDFTFPVLFVLFLSRDAVRKYMAAFAE